MATTISHSVQDCLAAFRALLALRDGELEDNAGIHAEDSFARFKVWAGNIGAHQTGRRSMEYRLRDASHIKKEVLHLLGQLSELLHDACAVVKGERVPWDKLPEDNDDDSDEEDQDEVDYDRDGDTLDNTPADKSDGGDDDNFPSTEMEQIIRNVGDIISCLLRLSIAIRNPAPHDRFRASHETDTSSYEPFDILHVHNKFPDMDKMIAERLGRANSLRRQYFKYREAHHMKLAEGLEASLELERIDLEPARTEALPSTVASSVPDAIKQDNSFDLQATTVDEDETSVTGASQTSFATSVSTKDGLGIPPLPAEAQYGPFECPFCFMIICATTRRAWKKHVFRDLRPYICLHRDCEMPDQNFGRRHEWIAHVTQYHWKKWQCPTTGCSETFKSAADCETHVTGVHPCAFPPSQLPYAVRSGERPMQPEHNAQCPFCNGTLASAKAYHKHVARHQEQVALFGLPDTDIPEKSDDEDDEDGSDTDDPSELGSNDPGSFDELEKTVKINIVKYGSDHHNTLKSMYALSSICKAQGLWDKAENLLVHVMEASTRTLGADHPNTLDSITSLVFIYSQQGRWDEAEKLQVQVMEASTRTLGADHPNSSRNLPSSGAFLHEASIRRIRGHKIVKPNTNRYRSTR